MSMPRPGPPRRRCTRFRTDGSKCGELTTHRDGWCHECEGFTTPDPGAYQIKDRVKGNSRRWQPVDGLPLDAEDAYEVSVSASARREFASRHGVTERQAEAQLRSMLEDFLLAQAPVAARGDGVFKIAHEGYSLVLAPDYSVVSYFTVHLERTWAQVKAGVPSRVTRRKRPGEKVWLGEALENSGVRVPCSYVSLNLFAKFAMGITCNKVTVEEVLGKATGRINGALNSWDGSLGRHVLIDPEDSGQAWVLDGDEEQEPKIIGFIRSEDA